MSAPARHPAACAMFGVHKPVPHPPAAAELMGGRTAMSDARRQAKQAYASQPRTAGVLSLTNTGTGRTLLVSSLDLRAARNRIEFELQHGSHQCIDLQRDVDTLGWDHFAFLTLEQLSEASDDARQLERRLEEVEARYAQAADPAERYENPSGMRIPPARRHRVTNP